MELGLKTPLRNIAPQINGGFLPCAEDCSACSARCSAILRLVAEQQPDLRNSTQKTAENRAELCLRNSGTVFRRAQKTVTFLRNYVSPPYGGRVEARSPSGLAA